MTLPLKAFGKTERMCKRPQFRRPSQQRFYYSATVSGDVKKYFFKTDTVSDLVEIGVNGGIEPSLTESQSAVLPLHYEHRSGQ